VGNLAEPIVPPVVAQTEFAVRPAHVFRESLEAAYNLFLFMSMVGHEAVDVYDEILPGALFHIVVMERLQVGMFVFVTLKQKLLVVCPPNLVEGVIRSNNISPWNPHSEKEIDAGRMPKNIDVGNHLKMKES
jgi:hypothetical protein